MQPGLRADRVADLANLQLVRGFPERGPQILDIGLAQVTRHHALEFGRLGLHRIAAGDFGLQQEQFLLRGGHARLGRVGAQADRGLLQADHLVTGPRSLGAQQDDVDAVVDRNGLRQLARAKLVHHGPQLGLQFSRAEPAGVAAVGRGRGRRELARDRREGRALL